MTELELVLTLLAVLILVLISSAIIYVQWWRRKFRQEHADDVGSVTGHSTHSTASKEMMYFMCWENSSQVAALGVPMSPASTSKGMPPAMITTHKEPPAFVAIDMHPIPHPPPSASPLPPPVHGRIDLAPKPQAAARDVDLNPASIPPGYNVSRKIYPSEKGTLFTEKDAIEDGERKGSSATRITAGNVFRQPSTGLLFTTPAQSPPFCTPLSSPLRSTEGEVSNLHTSSSLPSSKDVVERFYSKKVTFEELPHVKIMVG